LIRHNALPLRHTTNSIVKCLSLSVDELNDDDDDVVRGRDSQHCIVFGVVQGAYVGVTTGLLLTLWIGVGALVYKPPIVGHTPPPMTTAECPYRNGTELMTSTALPQLSSASDGFAPVAGLADMYVQTMHSSVPTVVCHLVVVVGLMHR